MEDNNEIKSLVEKNLKLNEEILSICKEIEHHNRLARIYSFIKTAIIVIPIIAGILLLSPYFNSFRKIFKSLDSYSQAMTELLK
ncbi:MAG TPA: hypothetical protein PLD95_02680 [bacterium]|jgi:hypothetical protein|nr:hypothetical protein [bacterium]HOG38356.1 hypothetical protein [bacterium]HQI03258.1 hypothetical protein [bacterium]